MKIIEGGNRWFLDVLKVRKKYGLDDWAFEIERHGAANSTKTTYAILPDVRLSAHQRQQIAACELHDLSRDAAAAASASFGEGAGNAGDPGGPVGMADAKELYERLKTMPKEAVASFFATVGIGRVSELRACDLEQARALLATDDSLPF